MRSPSEQLVSIVWHCHELATDTSVTRTMHRSRDCDVIQVPFRRLVSRVLFTHFCVHVSPRVGRLISTDMSLTQRIFLSGLWSTKYTMSSKTGISVSRVWLLVHTVSVNWLNSLYAHIHKVCRFGPVMISNVRLSRSIWYFCQSFSVLVFSTRCVR